jgi:hypothetical protein
MDVIDVSRAGCANAQCAVGHLEKSLEESLAKSPVHQFSGAFQVSNVTERAPSMERRKQLLIRELTKEANLYVLHHGELVMTEQRAEDIYSAVASNLGSLMTELTNLVPMQEFSAGLHRKGAQGPSA